MRKKIVYSALHDGIDLKYIFGNLTKKDAKLPVAVTVDITPTLKTTLLGFAGIIAGGIITVAVVRTIAKK